MSTRTPLRGVTAPWSDDQEITFLLALVLIEARLPETPLRTTISLWSRFTAVETD